MADEKMPYLRLGANGDVVTYLQEILAQQGFYRYDVDGFFGDRTHRCVKDFQATHLGFDKKALEVDGIVGPNTWFSLRNPSGHLQDEFQNKATYESSTDVSGLLSLIPCAQNTIPWRILSTAFGEFGVHEVPDGSNWGDGVEKYGGQPGWAWCCLYGWWVLKQVLGKNAFGTRHASCYNAMKAAISAGYWTPIDAKKNFNYAVPGDAFIMQYGGGKGHFGFIAQIDYTGSIFTVEGNIGNSVGFKIRDIKAPIVGFIRFTDYIANTLGWEFNRADFEPGIFDRSKIEGIISSASGTR